MFKLLLFFFALNSPVSAQTVQKLTLSDCIQRALREQIDIQLGILNQEQSELDLQQSLWNLGPDLNFNAGQFYQSGRNIDRFSNQFVQETVGNTSVQMQSSWVIYAGGSLRKAVQRSAKQLKSSEFDLQQTRQNIVLSVALVYLQCLQSQELLKANESNVESLIQEQKRIEKWVQSGMSNEGILFSARAQVAQAKVQKVQIENQWKTNLLNLRNMLRIPFQETFELVHNLITPPEYVEYPVKIEDFVDSALLKRSDYRSALIQLEAAELNIGISKGQLLPVVSIGANLNTIYSDKAQTVTGFQITGNQPIGYVRGSNEIVEAPTFRYQTQTVDFSRQMRDNFGQSFGANISLPIFNKMRAQNGIKTAKILWKQQGLNTERIKQNAMIEMSNAYLNFRNAAMSFQAQRENHEAQQKNLEFTQKRYENGQATYFELQLAKNQEIMAYQNLLSTKYEASLRNMILDVLYRGDLDLITQP